MFSTHASKFDHNNFWKNEKFTSIKKKKQDKIFTIGQILPETLAEIEILVSCL
jgi:hypothetical protein